MVGPANAQSAPSLQAKPGLEMIPPYVPGAAAAEGVAMPIKLSANENILGCSPLATKAFEAASASLHLYPDGGSTALRFELAKRNNLDPARIICGSGSDEILGLIAAGYLRPADSTVQGEHAYLCYRNATRIAMAEPVFAKENGYRADVDTLLGQVTPSTRIVFLANPANPTGTWLNGQELRRLHAALPSHVLLVVDGAYVEFVDDENYEDGLALAAETENVVVTRTFSKIYGLAGLRIGWGYIPTAMAEILGRIRPPFNVNQPAQLAACAALMDDEFLKKSRDLVIKQRASLTERLRGLNLVVPESGGNFVMVEFPHGLAKKIEKSLNAKGYLVRDLMQYRLPDCLRITIGLPEHNKAVAEIIEGLLGAA